MCRKNTKKGLSLIIFLLTTEIVGVSDIKSTFPSPDVVIPRNKQEYVRLTQYLNCSNGTVPIYLLNGENETVLRCFEDVKITGKYCAELNNGVIQERYSAFCGNFSVTPCVFRYNASESYTYFECFEKYGGIPSPLERINKIKTLEIEKSRLMKKYDELKTTNICHWLIPITVALLLLILYVFLAGFFIRKFKYNEDITYLQFLKSLCAFRRNLYQVSCEGKDLCLRANASFSKRKSGFIAKSADEVSISNLSIREDKENDVNSELLDLDGEGNPISIGKTTALINWR